MPTQFKRFNPPTFEVKNGLENGAYPFIFAKNAKKRLKKRSIAVHHLRGCVADHRNRMENGALPFTPRNGSRCYQDACDRKTEHCRSHFPKDVSVRQKNGALPFTFPLFFSYCM